MGLFALLGCASGFPSCVLFLFFPLGVLGSEFYVFMVLRFLFVVSLPSIRFFFFRTDRAASGRRGGANAVEEAEPSHDPEGRARGDRVVGRRAMGADVFDGDLVKLGLKPSERRIFLREVEKRPQNQGGEVVVQGDEMDAQDQFGPEHLVATVGRGDPFNQGVVGRSRVDQVIRPGNRPSLTVRQVERSSRTKARTTTANGINHGLTRYGRRTRIAGEPELTCA